jgi:uncharacterized protein
MITYILYVIGGFIIGTLGTLIGAGGGFILVPVLLILYPNLPTETITAISMAVVAANAISGTFAYAKSGRIDYKAGILFTLYTIPGTIVGTCLVAYISRTVFDVVFGVLLLVLAVYLWVKNQKSNLEVKKNTHTLGLTFSKITDGSGNVFEYYYNKKKGIIISIFVGFISPILGIGGGIIHVPAMVNWLRFPVFIATATSHFVLAIMASITVIIHAISGNYNDAFALKMVLLLAIGVIPGAQLGAKLSHELKGNTIIKALAFCLFLVGIRILSNVL